MRSEYLFSPFPSSLLPPSLTRNEATGGKEGPFFSLYVDALGTWRRAKNFVRESLPTG